MSLSSTAENFRRGYAALGGIFAEMGKQVFPAQVVDGIRDSINCNLYFFGNSVSIGMMYAILAGSAAIRIGIYVLVNLAQRKAK